MVFVVFWDPVVRGAWKCRKGIIPTGLVLQGFGALLCSLFSKLVGWLFLKSRRRHVPPCIFFEELVLHPGDPALDAEWLGVI